MPTKRPHDSVRSAHAGRAIDPECFATIVGYDAAGNVEWRASGQNFTGYQLTNQCHQANVAAGQKTSYIYDTRNRLKDTFFGDGSPSITATYHADGLLWTMTSNGHAWTYGYNGRGLLESETLSSAGSTFAINHTYNSNGHEASLTYPGAATVDYLPNGLGEPTRVGTYATAVGRHVTGALKSFSYGNGVYHDSTKTTRGMPDVVSDTGATSILNENYDWDENGNVRAITSSAAGAQRSRTMTYDARDRLDGTYFTDYGAQVSFTYDPLDNLRNYTTPARIYTNTYDSATWRLTDITNNANTVMYSYSYGGDAGKRGNVTTRGKLGAPANAQTYTFDQANRLSQLSGTFSESYTYDGHGRRTTIQVGANPKKFQLYSQSGKLLQVGATGAVGTERYLYLGAHLVAKVITGAGGTTTTRYQHTDGLGSPVAETDGSGALIAGSRQLHEPYGLVSFGTPTQGPGFTGHVYDAQSGLSYMQQRYYDPIAGRFLSVDPVVADASTGANYNRYGYANNNPYTFIDPDGRFVWLAAMAVGAGVGAVANIGTQMFRAEGGFSDRVSQVSWGQVGVAAAAGALGGGAGAVASTAATTGGTIAANVVAGAAIGAVQTHASAAVDGRSASVSEVAQGAALSGGLSGAAGLASAAPGMIQSMAAPAVSPLERVGIGNILSGISNATASAGGVANFAPAGQGVANGLAASLGSADNLQAQPKPRIDEKK